MSDMQPPLDEDLMRRFEDARVPLPFEAFLERFERRRTRVRRLRVALHAGGLALLAAGGLVITPYAIRGSLALSAYATDGLSSLGLAMLSPAGWAGSLLLGAWILRRCHVFDR